jgi:hypothetical protein
MTHKFKIKLTFDKGNAVVFPGMYAKVNLDSTTPAAK